MAQYAQIELILSSVSAALLLKIVALYISFPRLFLRHPNQLYFYSIILLIIGLFFTISMDVMILKYYLYRNSYIFETLYFRYIQFFIFLVFYHYILALNFEIIIKIFRASSQGYKKRVCVYHIITYTLSVVLILLVLSLTNFDLNDRKALNDKFTYNLVLWYVYIMSLAMWICIGIYFKEMVKSKSKSLLNLVLLTIGINLTVLVSMIIPQIAYYFDEDVYNQSLFNLLEAVFSSAGGILIYVILISDRKRFRLIKSVMQQQTKRLQNPRHRKKTFSFIAQRSLSGFIAEINNSKEEGYSGGGLLTDYFDSVTKEVLNI